MKNQKISLLIVKILRIYFICCLLIGSILFFVIDANIIMKFIFIIFACILIFVSNRWIVILRRRGEKDEKN